MAEVRTIMSVRQSQNQREIQSLKDKLDNSVDILKYKIFIIYSKHVQY